MPGYPIDIEAALAAALGSVFGTDVGVSAPPLPAGYTAGPFVLITRTGGTQLPGHAGRVYTTHSVSIDCYADTWATAQNLASWAAGVLMALPGETLAYDWLEDPNYPCEVPVYTVDCGMPYTNPDPMHPNVPRVTFTANLATGTY